MPGDKAPSAPPVLAPVHIIYYHHLNTLSPQPSFWIRICGARDIDRSSRTISQRVSRLCLVKGRTNFSQCPQHVFCRPIVSQYNHYLCSLRGHLRRNAPRRPCLAAAPNEPEHAHVHFLRLSMRRKYLALGAGRFLRWSHCACVSRWRSDCTFSRAGRK